MRRFAIPAIFAILCLAPAAARAQLLSVYGTFSPLHASNVETGSVLVAVPGTGGGVFTNQEQYTSFFTPAFGGGVTLRLFSLGPVQLGADLRGATKAGTTGADTALFGIRAALKLPLLKLKPYVQGSVGYLATRTANVSTLAPANSTFTNQYAAYEIMGGIDYRLGHFVDLRVVEIGVGQGLDFLGTADSNVTFYTINTGVVLHF